MSVREILQAEVARIRGDVAKLEDHATKLEARLAALPEEVMALSEDAWEHVKAMFGFPSKYLNQASEPATTATEPPAGPPAA